MHHINQSTSIILYSGITNKINIIIVVAIRHNDFQTNQTICVVEHVKET